MIGELATSFKTQERRMRLCWHRTLGTRGTLPDDDDEGGWTAKIAYRFGGSSPLLCKVYLRTVLYSRRRELF
jgi:hypothetical protein